MTRITRKFLSNTRAVVYFLPQLSSVRAAQPHTSGFSHQKEVIRDMRRQNASLLSERRKKKWGLGMEGRGLGRGRRKESL